MGSVWVLILHQSAHTRPIYRTHFAAHIQQVSRLQLLQSNTH